MAARDIEAGKAFVRLYLRNDMNRGLQRAAARLQAFGQQVSLMGTQLAALGAAVLTPVALAVRSFAGFDDAMRQVAAVTGAVGDEFDMLTRKAKHLGATTSYTSTEVAALMVTLGQAGFTATEIDKLAASVLSLARSTGTEAAVAAGIMSAAVRQFGLDASQASRVADVLTATANKSFTTLEQLGEALQYAGPIAADFNLSIEETAALLGTLGNVGIQGSNAGTALRRLLTITGAEAEKLKDIFGVTFVDAAGNARPLVDTLQEVTEATADLGTAARSAKFNEAFGLLGITGASALAKNTQGARDLLTELEKAGGVAERTAKKMESGIGGFYRIFISAVDGVSKSISTSLEPALIGILSRATELAAELQDFIDKNQDFVRTVVAGATAIAGLGAGLIAVGTAISAAAGLLAMFSGAIAAIASPIGIGTLALVAGAAALAQYLGVMEKLGTVAGSTFGLLREGFEAADAQQMVMALQLGFEQIKLIGLEAWESVKQGWKESTASMRVIFYELVDRMAQGGVSLARAIIDPVLAGIGNISMALLDVFEFISKTGAVLQKASLRQMLNPSQAINDPQLVGDVERAFAKMRQERSGTIASDSAAMQSQMDAALQRVLDFTGSAAADAHKALSDAIHGGTSEGVERAKRNIEELRDALDLRKWLTERKPVPDDLMSLSEFASAVSGLMKGGGAAGAADAAAAGLEGIGQQNSSVFQSAASLLAGAGGGSPAKQIVDSVHSLRRAAVEADRAARKEAAAQAKRDEDMIDALGRLGFEVG